MMIDIHEAKKALESLRERLIAELQEVGRINPSDTTDWEPVAESGEHNSPEIEERASEIEDFEERSAVEYELEDGLRKVDAALQRIADGTYGKCSVCEIEIEIERLRANPSATTCVLHKD